MHACVSSVCTAEERLLDVYEQTGESSFEVNGVGLYPVRH